MLIRVNPKRAGRQYGYRHAWRDKKGNEHSHQYTVGSEVIEVPDDVGAAMVHTYEDVEEVTAVPETLETPSDETGDDDSGPKTPLGDNQYFCSKCNKPHMKEGYKIGEKHRQYAI